MKLFISWSGERSKIVAEALRQWIPDVFQTVEPWMSSSDIDAGSRWSQDLQNQLEQTQFGIICLTSDNLFSPWIHFEAGALAKTVKGTHVCPYLIQLEPSDIPQGPLTQFQSKVADKKSNWELVCTINKSLPEKPLENGQLERAFEKWWPDLEKKISEVPKLSGIEEITRSPDDMVREILEIVRGLRRDKLISSQLESINFMLTKDNMIRALATGGTSFAEGLIPDISSEQKLRDALQVELATKIRASEYLGKNNKSCDETKNKE